MTHHSQFTFAVGAIALLALGGCTGASVDESAPPVLSAMEELGQQANEASTDANETSTDLSVDRVSESDARVNGVFKAKFETTVGSFVIEVDRSWAPIGAQRFYELVKDKAYDDTAFFRVLPDFMVQFGIPGDPQVASKWDVEIRDDPVIKSNQPGYVTFAKTGLPNSRTTQIFINYVNNDFLDEQGFSPFGKVVEGMDVVRKINSEYGGNPSEAQHTIKAQGNAFLKENFPNLDYVKKVTLIEDDLATQSEDSEAAE